MLKVAIVGVGGISGSHIPSWQKMPETELVAMCDIRPEQMDKYEDVRKYTSFDEMLEKEELDIIDICLPTYLHVEYSIKAMKKKINVLCEKPVSLNPEDAQLVYKVAEENNVKFMIAHVLRFWPEYMYLREVYNNKTFGKLLSGFMSRLGGIPKWSWDGWMTDEKRSGLVPFDLHIHDLDFMVYTFGKPTNTHSRRSKLPDQDYFSCVYDFDGFSVSAEASWYASPYPFTVQFKFQFENAIVAMEPGKGLTVYQRGGKVFQPLKLEEGQSGVINVPTTDAYGNEIQYFTDCVINDTPCDVVKADELEEVVKILKSI